MVARRIRIGSSPSYTGPGDIVSGAEFWVGLRAYSAAAIGSNAIELRRDSDNTAQTFVTLSDGSLDVASIATFKGAANLFVRTLYDQTGNARHALQTTNSNQMSFTLSGLGSLPIITASAATAQIAQTSGSVTLSQPMTVSAVANYDGVAGRWTYFGDVGGNVFCGHRGTQAICYAGTEIGPTISNGWRTAQNVLNGASSDCCIDGASSTGNAGANTISTALIIGSDGSGANWNSDLTEVGLWGVAFSAGEKTAMDANQQAYWGI